MKFTNRVITLGEMADKELARQGDYPALIRLLVARSGETEDTVRAIPMSELVPLIDELAASLEEAAKVSVFPK